MPYCVYYFGTNKQRKNENLVITYREIYTDRSLVLPELRGMIKCFVSPNFVRYPSINNVIIGYYPFYSNLLDDYGTILFL